MQETKSTEFNVGERVVYPKENRKGTVIDLTVYGAVEVKWDNGQQQLMNADQLRKIESGG